MGDKKIKCIVCHKDFIFTAAEHQFYEEKGYDAPKRCNDCLSKRKAEQRTQRF